MPYIKSLLDTDFYSLTVQNAILDHYPNTPVTYRFTNRDTKMKFSGEAYNRIIDNIKALADLRLTDDEYNFLQGYKFLKKPYLEYLRNFKFNPEQVKVQFLDGDLDITVSGPWEETLFFEVPLLAIISEAYFDCVDTHWKTYLWRDDQEEKALEKCRRLSSMKDKFTDFGTRRRRSYAVQDLIIKTFKESNTHNFFGTSNVHLAHKYGLKCIGTVSHQWTMGVSALESLRYANRFALQKWQETYQGSLGYALTDTFGTDAFFKDFNETFARVYDGVRQDSGCPFTFADKVINHYNSLGIDPTTKLIVFSDSLDVEKALAISKHCNGRVRCSFGIGTAIMNSFPNSKALNIVIKLSSVKGIPVVKLSDSPTKATGDKDALRIAKWTFFGTPLDQ
jgi:nicotinate phosphoribosyltransferase